MAAPDVDIGRNAAGDAPNVPESVVTEEATVIEDSERDPSLSALVFGDAADRLNRVTVGLISESPAL